MKTETLFEKAKKISENAQKQAKLERIQFEDPQRIESSKLLFNSLLQKHEQ